MTKQQQPMRGLIPALIDLAAAVALLLALAYIFWPALLQR